MAENETRWGGELWAAADLITPMAIRVAATLRLADHIAAGTERRRRWPPRWMPTRTRWGG